MSRLSLNPERAMPGATSPLQILVQAALQGVAQSTRCFEGFRLTAAFDPSWNGSITATLVAMRPLVGPIWVDLQLDTVSDSGTRREFLDFEDFAAAMRAVASLFPGAVVRSGSVQVKTAKSSGAKLEPIAAQAWYEVFGQPIPSLDELAERRIASKERLQALLRTGPDGVSSFNRLPRIERTQADLSQCRLDGVDFAGANLEKADLSGASLVEADFGGKTQAEFAPPRIKGVKGIGADLSRAMLGDAHAADADFSRAVLQGAQLSLGSFLRARFMGAELSGASFFCSDVRGADFTDANLKGVQFAGAKFDEQTRWPKRFYLSAEMDWRGKGSDPRRSRKKTTAKPMKASGSGSRKRKSKR